MRHAARVKSRCLVIFIHQRLKIAQRAIGFGAGQGRGQVVNNHRLRTAFRLCPLAGVINDERIQMRHRPQRNFRPASIAQRHSLARQPFQIAVFSHMDNRIRPPMFAQPDVEGQIVMRRDQVGGMVGFGRVDVIAARRLQADDRVAETVDRQGKTGGRISDQKRVSFGGTPAGGDLRFHLPWQGVEVLQIGGQRQHLTAVPVCPVGQPVGRPGHQPVHQRLRIGGKGVNLIPRPGQQVQRMNRGRRGIKAHPIGQTPVFVRIIRQNDRHFALCSRGGAQPCPVGGQPGHKIDPVILRLIGGDRALGGGVKIRLGLETDRAGQDAPVHLGQGDVHRDIGGGQAACAAGPTVMGGAGQDHLKHRGGVGRRGGQRVFGAGVARVR